MKTRIVLAAGSMLALLTAGPAAAQPVSATPNNNAIHYKAGGVGVDARAEMQQLAASHNLLVKFAEISGDYVVPDSVAVRKDNKDVLNITDAGPLLYVNLPNGAYTVSATYKGVVRSKSFNVAGRAPDVVLTWPAQLN